MSTGSLGDLVVSLSANTAKFEAAMNRAEYMATQMSKRVDAAMSFAGGAIAALGAGGALAGLVAMTKQAIDTADAMDEMSQKIGLSVDKLSALDYAMRKEGVSTQAFGAAMKTLAGNMVEAGAEGTKMSQIFKLIGADAGGSSRDALLKFSDAFAALPDGAIKSQLAVEAFGKAGLDLIPALNQGAEGVIKLEEEARRLGLTFSGETAAAAGQFNDNLFVLKESTKSLGIAMAVEVLPGLKDITTHMAEATREGGLLYGIWVGLGGAMTNLLGLEGAADTVRSLNGQIKETTEEIVRLTAMKNQPNAIFGPMSQKRLDDYNAKLADLEKRLQALKGSAGPAGGAAMDAHVSAFLAKEIRDALAAPELAKRAAAERKRIEEAAAKEMERIRKLDFDGWANAYRARTDAVEDAAIAEGQIRLREQKKRIADEQKAEQANLEWLRQMQQMAFEEQFGIWDDLSNIAGGFAGNLVNGVGSAFDYLKQQAKSFLAEMLAIFAKRWVLNIAAGTTGMTSFSAMAGQVGQGSAPGSLLNMLSGGGGLGASALASLGGGIIGMGGSFAGGLGAFVGGIGELGLLGSLGASTSAGMTALASGNIMGGLGSLAGPAAMAIMAIYALHKAFGDKGENWKGQLGFGGSANAYTSNSIFGTQGFANLQGNDAVNRSIQQFMAGTSGLDAMLGKGLTPDQIARITGNLAGYNRRTDGQPAEFAFSKDDKTASAQLTLEFLKAKYGVVFDELDKTFADFIRGYTGKSEDLLQQIGAFAQVIESISGTSIKGLNIESLRAMTREGEELGDTMNRIAGDMASLNSMFIDETDAYLQALQFVGDEFAALGVELPVNADSFKQLRDSLDLSTEAGRAMYDMLVRVAPAMQQIDQAAQAMMNGFNAAMGQIFGSGYTRQLIELQATGLVSRFQSMTGLLQGVDPLAVFRNISNNQSDIQYIMANYGPDVQSLLTQIIQLYAQYIGLQETVNTNTGSLGTVIGTTIDQLAQARAGLREYLDSLFLNESLSPLTTRQRFADAEMQYQRLLGLAQGGDVSAIGNLPGITDQYLSLARQLYASSSVYNDIFRQVTSGIGAVAGVSQGEINQRLANALPQGSTMMSEATGQMIVGVLTDLQERLNSPLDTTAPAVEQALADMKTEIEALRREVANA